jgi:hypothetical protein
MFQVWEAGFYVLLNFIGDFMRNILFVFLFVFAIWHDKADPDGNGNACS